MGEKRQWERWRGREGTLGEMERERRHSGRDGEGGKRHWERWRG